MKDAQTFSRRRTLKGFGSGMVALGALGTVGTVSASQVHLDAYVYVNQYPLPDSLSGMSYYKYREEMAGGVRYGLENLFDEVSSSGHCDMTYDVHFRVPDQKSNNDFPSVSAGDISGFKNWLQSAGYTEGAASGDAALHHLVRQEDGIQGGGRANGRVCWPDNTSLTCSMHTAEYQGAWNRFTAQHEVGHNMVDASIGQIENMTHDSASECQHASSNETIHNRDHTLGTVRNGGKTVMAHRSPTAAECTGDGNGSGVGGDNARGTGISPGLTSHAADKAFGITKRNNS